MTFSTALMKPTQRRLIALFVNTESERMWKDGVVDKHRHLPGRKTKWTKYLAPGRYLHCSRSASPRARSAGFCFFVCLFVCREAGPSYRISCLIPVCKKKLYVWRLSIQNWNNTVLGQDLRPTPPLSSSRPESHTGNTNPRPSGL